MIPDNNPRTEAVLAPFRPDEDAPYIFISYSHEDRDRVFPIITRLYEKGWHIWYDEGLKLTENYFTSLSRHIKNCTVFLLFVTENSVNSEFVSKHELLLAAAAGKRIVLCYLDKDAQFTGEAKDAIDLAAVSKKNPRTDEAGLESALEGINKLTRFAPRKAEGYRILINADGVIEPAQEDDEYEYEKCEGGVRLTRYLGRYTDITVPDVYKGLPVRELAGKSSYYPVFELWSFAADKGTFIIIPPTVTVLGGNTFSMKNNHHEDPAEMSPIDLYLPPSIKKMNANFWDYRQRFLRFCRVHCTENSYPYQFITQRFPLVNVIVDHAFASDQAQAEAKPGSQFSGYGFCSYTEDQRAQAEHIIRQLKDNGCSVASSLNMTEKQKIKSLRRASCMIAFLSQGYIEEDEIEYLHLAIESGKKHMVYVLDRTAFPEDLSVRKGSEQHLRFDTGTESDRIAKLTQWLSDNGCRTSAADIPDYSYYTVNGGGIVLTKYNGSEKTVAVPGKYAGHPVVRLEYTFERSKVTSVTIPHGVEEIGKHTFYGCKTLVRVSIPQSVTRIGLGAFSGCTDLTKIRIPDSVSEIGPQAFRWCHQLKEISIPESVTKIGEGTFSMCWNLREMTLPDGLKEIEDTAFEACSIEEISIPASVETIRRKAFSGCYRLRAVFIQGDHTRLADQSRKNHIISGSRGAVVYCRKNSAAWEDCQRYGIPCRPPEE